MLAVRLERVVGDERRDLRALRATRVLVIAKVLTRHDAAEESLFRGS